MKASKVLFLVFLVLIIVGIGVISLYVGNHEPVEPSPKTIVVPDDYATIEWAIGNATNGDTIYVKSGIYSVNRDTGYPLRINKPLSLIGENSNNTTIIGGSNGEHGSGAVTISVESDNVTISGFTIKSYDFPTSAWAYSGISIGADYCRIIGNNIVNCATGIRGGGSFSVISNNSITDNFEYGLQIGGGNFTNITISGNNLDSNENYFDADNSVIFGNNITNSWWGIFINSNCAIYGNNITGNTNYGISMVSNNTVFENYIANNSIGIRAGNHNTVYNNNFINNTQQINITSNNTNSWDNGTAGNYWSNYNGTDNDKDGIGDTPYIIDANNQDRCPLVEPYPNYSD